MQTSSLFNPLTPTVAPFSGKLRQPKRAFRNDSYRLATTGFKKDSSSGKMVDENMIVLRERIRQMKSEMEYYSGGDWLPDNWMQWEKTYIYSGGYHSHVYEVVALLQRFLMDSRPSVALGLVVVLAVGGSTAAVAVLQCLMNSIQGS